MVTSSSRLSYSDCYELLDAALTNERGIKVQVTDFNSGNYFRMRLHAARKIDRDDNSIEYSAGHPLHGRSVYDELVVRVKEDDGAWWMYLEKVSMKGLNVVPLGESDVNQTDDGDHGETAGAGEGERAEGESPVESPTGEIEKLFDPQDEVEVKTARPRRI